MPSIGMAESPVAGRSDVVELKLNGTLDIATLPEFESALRRLRASGFAKVVVDLGGLEYISSSGLGSFLGMVDHFRKAGGDLVFVRLGERVAKIFKVVGFNRFLTITADLAGALEHFAGPKADLSQLVFSPASSEPHSGEAFEMEILAADSRGLPVESFNGDVLLRPSTGIVSPAKAGPFKAGVWRGQVILTGPGKVELKAVSGETSSGAVFKVVESKTPAVLPLHLACPGCGLRTEIRAFNVYRCRDCDEVYFVDRWAHAIPLKPGRRDQAAPTKLLAVSLPSDVNLLAGLRVFVTSVLKEHGYSGDLVNDIELAADEAVTNVIEHAYRYDAKRTVWLEVHMDKGEVRVVVKDDGEAFVPGEAATVDLEKHIAERRTGGLGVHLMHTVMDSVSHMREGGKNILVLTRKVRA